VQFEPLLLHTDRLKLTVPVGVPFVEDTVTGTVMVSLLPLGPDNVSEPIDVVVGYGTTTAKVLASDGS
jgi:hypothetical protein